MSMDAFLYLLALHWNIQTFKICFLFCGTIIMSKVHCMILVVYKEMPGTVMLYYAMNQSHHKE